MSDHLVCNCPDCQRPDHKPLTPGDVVPHVCDSLISDDCQRPGHDEALGLARPDNLSLRQLADPQVLTIEGFPPYDGKWVRWNPPCNAPLNIKGEAFICDKGWGHALPHGNTEAGAIWDGEQPPNDSPEPTRGKDALVSWEAIDKLRDTYPPSPGSDMNAVDYFLREVVGDR